MLNKEQLEDELALEEEGTVQVATTLHALVSTVLCVKILTDCRNKLIPLSIVSSSFLRADLKTLQTNLHIRNRTLSIPIDRLNTYYHLPLSSCLVSPTKDSICSLAIFQPYVNHSVHVHHSIYYFSTL